MYYALISSMNRVVYDTDALAFINAANITNTTQKLAINDLVKDLKTAGIWAKCYAIYPFVGGTAFSHKWNLKDPRDLNGVFRLTFNGGISHSSNGIQGNGVNGEANTWFDTQWTGFTNNNHITTYILSDIDENAVDMGFYTPTYQTGLHNLSKFSNISTIFNYINNSYSTFSNTDARGFYINTRTSNSLSKVYKNELLKNTITGTTSLPFIQTYLRICARGNASYGVEGYYSSKKIGFASIGAGLTDTEALNYNTAVQKFQIAIGRQFNVPIVSDADAQAFLNAAYINDITQANAINTLVIDLKSNGLWTKMKAIYPFVGGTAFTHKFNLKDPRNLDAAFRLTFNGGITHNSTGILPNGSNGYANTWLSPAANLQLNSSSITYYSRTDLNYTGGASGTRLETMAEMGATNSGTNAMWLFLRTNNILSTGINRTGAFTVNNTNSTGFYITSRTSSNLTTLFKNNLKLADSSVLSTNLTSLNMYLFGINTTNNHWYPSVRECCYSSIGDGLTDTEAANYYTIVQTYQTTLGRQV